MLEAASRRLPAGKTPAGAGCGRGIIGRKENAVGFEEAIFDQTGDAVFECDRFAGPGYTQDDGRAELVFDNGLLGRRKRRWRHFKCGDECAGAIKDATKIVK